jgi:hypothetical protein
LEAVVHAAPGYVLSIGCGARAHCVAGRAGVVAPGDGLRVAVQLLAVGLVEGARFDDDGTGGSSSFSFPRSGGRGWSRHTLG